MFERAAGDDHDNLIMKSKQSNYREAYSAFVTDQLDRHEACNVSFFSFLTSFDKTRPSEKRKKVVDPPLFLTDPCPCVCIIYIYIHYENKILIIGSSTLELKRC